MNKKLTLQTPFGTITIVEENEFIIAVNFNDDNTCCDSSPLLEKARAEFEEYFEKRRTLFTLPVKTNGTPFEEKIWEALKSIPYGETISYQELAERAGNSKASRAAGGAVHRNPVPILLPCHRVIGKNGSLTGFGRGLEIKQYLLDLEKSATLQ